ncbi:MAG: dihydroorotase [Armatimonadetes bacterium]|nr:dihydroorotase [Armatimonadota bacterium]
MSSLLLRGGRVIDPANSRDETADLHVDDGLIVASGGAEVIDCGGLWVCPGLIDPHVHFREPGQTHKEDIDTGSMSAAAGGYASVACMPNTSPSIDNPELVRQLMERAKNVRLYVVAAMTEGMAGERLTDYAALKEAGAIAVSDDAYPLQSARMMREGMRLAARVGLPVVTHCEDKSLTVPGAIHEGEVAERLGVPGMPSVAEEIHIARNALLALETGAHLHVQHLSTALGIDLIRYFRQLGAKITCEVAPHHLLLTDKAVLAEGTMAKMNPPLRTQKDADALSQALIQGEIDHIATDHAPHTAEEKTQPLGQAPFGIVGLETALPLMLEWNRRHGDPLSPMRLIELMSTAPARVFGLNAGSLSPGQPADIVVIDPDRERMVKPQDLKSKSKNTPFGGWILRGWPVMTILGGRIVHDAR